VIRRVTGKSEDPHAAEPSPTDEDDDAEPEDPQKAEIEELQSMPVEEIWPSEFIRLLSGQFSDSGFMDDEEDDQGCFYMAFICRLKPPSLAVQRCPSKDVCTYPSNC
jgi:hypothetical protein